MYPNPRAPSTCPHLFSALAIDHFLGVQDVSLTVPFAFSFFLSLFLIHLLGSSDLPLSEAIIPSPHPQLDDKQAVVPSPVGKATINNISTIALLFETQRTTGKILSGRSRLIGRDRRCCLACCRLRTSPSAKKSGPRTSSEPRASEPEHATRPPVEPNPLTTI